MILKYPDWRVGQIIVNALYQVDAKKQWELSHVFNVENEVLIEGLQKILEH